MKERKKIAQVKDPTTKLSFPPLISLFGVLIFVFNLTPQCLANYNFPTPSQNVTCIDHDAKFICDCHSEDQAMLLPLLRGSVYQVEITNCKALVIPANALEELHGLRKINLENIEHLVLEKYAFAYSRYASNTALVIEFRKVVLDMIDSHAFNGNIEEISFIGGRIDLIHAFGFTTLRERASLIRMDGVWFGRVEMQAFKRFEIENIEIKNCVFETNLPSKAFYELEVRGSLIISNVRFREVFSRAFSFKKISSLIIRNNYFDKVEPEWMEAQVLKTVIISDNHFGLTNEISFRGITLHRDYTRSEPLELRFLNNTVRFERETRPLLFASQFSLNIKQLQYENTFACNNVDQQLTPPQPTNVFFRKFVDDVYFLRVTTNSTSPKPKENQSYVVLSEVVASDCQPRSYLLFIILGVVGLVLLLALIAILVYCKWAQSNKRRKMDVVMPESRTYKETQIVYQIENAGLLKTDL